ncbi:MAG TPA: isoprenylcysteine carboxylmethyltransferase family protein [Porticoccaceae bacterium]|jgi:protein-S-isoprenylcysteine O-methyltransferase Ste14|nr:isoprenylcysteine carboxylmethyltransferase family protein [Gammaproteobacteria bacterium]HIL59797.1 isoprenylcysteine carboxylmethyltransferase family protein [Porticoccaceae bacterium]
MNPLLTRVILGLAFLPVVIWLLILLPAGTNNFWQVYLYFSLLLILVLLGFVYFIQHDPALIERRLNIREKESKQKWLVLVMGISVITIYMISGFDKRFNWSDIPVWLVLLADLISLCGYMLILLVFKENSFAGRIIKVETDQLVVATGPYAHVRHPMYSGAILMYVTTPIALGSWWGLLPVIIISIALMVRSIMEEEVLQRDLVGYSDYSQQVKWRLIPAIW